MKVTRGERTISINIYKSLTVNYLTVNSRNDSAVNDILGIKMFSHNNSLNQQKEWRKISIVFHLVVLEMALHHRGSASASHILVFQHGKDVSETRLHYVWQWRCRHHQCTTSELCGFPLQRCRGNSTQTVPMKEKLS